MTFATVCIPTVPTYRLSYLRIFLPGSLKIHVTVQARMQPGHFPEIAAQESRGLVTIENLRHLPVHVISLVNSDK